MRIPFRDKRDVYSGLAMVLLGLFAAGVARNYPFGRATSMGPGFMPVWLGIILAGVGLLIILNALRGESTDSESNFHLPDARSSVCIIGGLLAFILFGKYFGFVPAALMLVFLSAIGDRKQTLKGAIILSVAVTSFSTLLFIYGLQLQFPMFTWML